MMHGTGPLVNPEIPASEDLRQRCLTTVLGYLAPDLGEVLVRAWAEPISLCI
jgi:hypothetical protein